VALDQRQGVGQHAAPAVVEGQQHAGPCAVGVEQGGGRWPVELAAGVQQAVERFGSDGVAAVETRRLRADVLDAVEQQLVPFARETVWYEPAQIQRRGRELLRTLSREQFLELVAVSALANVLCRLGFLVEAAA